MRIPIIIKRAAVVSTLVLLAVLTALSTQPVQAADPLVEGAMVLVPIGEFGAIASGAVEDTFKACLARIPEIASVGQRMLAEQSCAGEEGTRKSLQWAPKF
ncbi:MAG: hypothetical protein HY038_12315 [Nitrospirae bacterium]|nr:hypothetical protein [Nitrospirota bacterium]